MKAWIDEEAMRAEASPDGPEEWRSIEGWPYEVSNFGRVRRLTGRTAGRILRGDRSVEGYVRVSLNDYPRKKKTQLVSILVCTAFEGPKPSPQHEAAHLNGRPWINWASNLKWKTPKENSADRRAHGRDRLGEQHHKAKLREVDAKAILALLQTDRFSKKEIAAMFGVTDGLISHIEFGRAWKHLARVDFEPVRIRGNRLVFRRSSGAERRLRQLTS
jgi:hypothetical protein